jgi:hypothetical protein
LFISELHAAKLLMLRSNNDHWSIRDDAPDSELIGENASCETLEDRRQSGSPGSREHRHSSSE